MTNDDGERAVRDALDGQIDQSKRQTPPAASGQGRSAPEPSDGGGGFVIVGDRRPYIPDMPPDAPVRALGTHNGTLYFLDVHSQLRELPAKDLSRTNILHLWGKEQDWLYSLWPTLKKVAEDTYKVNGWDGTAAQESMLRACHRAGIWRPQEHVRGRGAWSEGEQLIIHAGQQLYFSDGRTERCGLVERNVYPAATTALVPAPPGDPDQGRLAAHELLKLFETWNWTRSFDARLLLGWIAAAMMGGALKVRPLVWVTGEKGTGKSSLVGENGVIHKLLGHGVLMTANTTAAGLYQAIRYDSLPVAIDEIEAKPGNVKTEAVIELARQSYSGGMVLRGGADHEGQEFRAQCPVLFGSILIPPLKPADKSRLAMLHLKPFAPDATEPDISDQALERIGRAMLRRVLSLWHEWPERLATWRDYLRSQGHDGRASDQFGTLLAAADLMLATGAPEASAMSAITEGMAPEDLSETQSYSSNAMQCIGYAMSRPMQSVRGGEQMMVSELVICAVNRYRGAMDSPVKSKDAVRFLERAGASVVVVKGADEAEVVKASKMPPAALEGYLDRPDPTFQTGAFVAFAPDGDGILDLFRGSDWEGVPGAHNPYVQALERVPGARRSSRSVRIANRICKPILIPLTQCVEVPTAEEAEQD